MKLKDHSTALIASIPFILGFLIMILSNPILSMVYGEQIPIKVIYLSVGLVFLCWSGTFAIVIWRKELPQFITIRGIPAVIIGIVGLLFCLYLAGVMLFSYITFGTGGGQ